MALLALTVWFLRAQALAIPGAPWVSARILVADLAVAALVAFLTLALVTGAAVLLRRRLPAPLLGVALGAAVLLATMGPGISRVAWAWVALVTLVTGAVLGSWVGRAVGSPRPRRGRVWTVLTGAVALVALVTGGWLAYPGSPGPGVQPERHGTAALDPSSSGPWTVREFSYGSGQSRLARYGADVEVVTDTVDASAALPEWRDGDTRTSVWGFDARALPLNATVWAPAGTGEFPLVLLLHGNAQHADSELGLAYLAEHLASRGYVVAAIDQSFLNTGLLDRAGGLARGDQVRGWLVRQHLAQWARWAASADSRVPDVTLDEVSLVGHSRGGEAVAVAAAADPPVALGLPRVDLAEVTISAVVALAPSDGLIVADPPLVLEGVDYLTLAGTHDADISTFAGTLQYERVSPGEGGLKAAVLIHRANHTQFNSLWERHDAGAGLATRLLNTGVLIAPEQQRDTTASLVAAFLEASVAGDEAARDLFTRPLPEAPWLPPTPVRVASAATGRAHPVPTEQLAGDASEVVALPSRTGSTDREVLLVQDADPAEVSLPPGLLADGSTLTLDLADAAPAGERVAPVTVHLAAVDAQGTRVSCDPVPVSPALDGRLGKVGVPTTGPDSEPFLETVRLPLDCLTEAGADRGALDTAALVVTGAGASGIYLDNARTR